MTDDEVRALVAKGLLKFPRAYARLMGWPRADNGLPAEWYAAFRGELGDQLARVLSR